MQGMIGDLKLVGLTGGIGAGKSTVAEMIRAQGVPVIDADQLAREVVEPGQPSHTQIVSAFGRGVLRPDGGIDRKALGAVVFADPAARARLESITHPAIRARVRARLAFSLVCSQLSAAALETRCAARLGSPSRSVKFSLSLDGVEPNGSSSLKSFSPGLIILITSQIGAPSRLLSFNPHIRHTGGARTLQGKEAT